MKRTIVNLLKETTNKYPNQNYLYEKTDLGWTPTTRCVSVPLSVKLTPDEVTFRLIHSESKAIVCSHNNIEKIIPILEKDELKKLKIIYIDNDFGFVKTLEEKYKHFSVEKNVLFFSKMIQKSKESLEENKKKLKKTIEKIEEDDVVNISYTSGTTGNPKGIMLTHLNYYANSLAASGMFDLPKFSKLFIILPLDHSFAHTAGTFVGLQLPLSLYFLDTRGGAVAALKNIPLNIKEVKPNLLLTVPALSGSFMKNIIQAIEKKGGFAKWLFNKGLKAKIAIEKDGFNKANKKTIARKHGIFKIADKLVFSKIRQNFGGEINFMVGGGALLDVKQQEFFNAIGMPIYQGYGLTEASPVISANTSNIHKFGTSGMLIEGVDCKIMDEGKEIPKGVKGEIFVKADSVMKGYFKNPDATAETLRDGGLYTGDLGYIDEDNFLVVTGREKALLISEDGEKYSPEEIEELISTSKFLNHVMLYNDHSKYTTAIITIDELATKSFIKSKKITSAEILLEHIEKSISDILNEGIEKGYFQKKWLPSIFRIANEQFSEENKMINSTMKMVRYKITEEYKNLIEVMYTNWGKTDKTHNTKMLEKLF